MHIFLTGGIQIGKTTLIGKVLKELPLDRLGGFRTITRPDIPGTAGSVYLVRAVEREPACGEENRVGIRRRPSTAFPEVFDRYGVTVLSDAEQNRLILMDEIGKMEKDASFFTKRVLELLDGKVPVFGVLRKEGNTPLQEQIRNHPNVQLIEVTLENRDWLVPVLVQKLSELLVDHQDSAGAFVWRTEEEDIWILMIRAKKGWGFPKGHIEENEDARGAAVREVCEETGIEIRIEDGFSYTTPSGKADEKRNVTYFLGTAFGGNLSPQLSEVRDAEWVRAEEVEERIQFPEDIPAWEAAWKEINERSLKTYTGR